MDQSQGLPTLDELASQGDALWESYAALKQHSPNSPECVALGAEVLAWLRDDVQKHGLYVRPGSQERRALRAMLDDSVSRLMRDGHPGIADLDDLAPYSDEAGVVLDIEPPPYPGLAAYRGDKREYFFGRDKLSEDYARALEASGIFAIIGDSGSGKSSVAMAGVRPKFEAAHAGWLFPEPFTPGVAPLRALADAITGCVGTADESLEDKLRDNPDNAAALISAYCGGRSLLLVVDQLEELITLCRDGTREIFGKVICALATPDALAHPWRCCALLTLRTDYLSRLGQHASELHVRIMSAEMKCNDNLPVLGVDGILQAIQRPAEKCRLRYLPSDIARELANQTAGMMSGLPLLQFALLRLWNNRKPGADGRPLDFINRAMVKQFLSDENGVLDVQGVLGRAAEDIFKGLKPRQQEICTRLMLELVLLDEDYEAPLRRRRNVTDLVKVIETVYEKDAEAAFQEAKDVRKRFEDAGLLLVIKGGQTSDDDQLEVVHEALLRHWPRIRNEISSAETKTRLHVVREIAREAAEWARNDKQPDYLKQAGKQLERVEGYKENAWLEEDVCNEYVEACAAEESRRKELKEKAEKGKRWRLLAAACGLIAVTVAVRSHSVKESNSANLGVVASLGERLPPREGLEVAYALAAHSNDSTLSMGGSPDYRHALGHALERMAADQILPGDRNAPLAFFGNGQVLRQARKVDETTTKFFFFDVSLDGKAVVSDSVSVVLDNADQIEAFEVGPAVSAADSKRLLVIIKKSKIEKKSVLAYWLDFKEKKVTNVFDGELDWASATWEVSPVNIHPDGKRAVWAVAGQEKDKNYGKLVQLDVIDGKGVLTLSKEGGVLASAVAFLAGSTSDATSKKYIVGKWDGSVGCEQHEFDDKKFVLDKAETELNPASDPPVVRIGTLKNTQDFVIARKDKRLAFSKCGETPVEVGKPLASIEYPGRSEIFRVSNRDRQIQVSFINAKREVDCFERVDGKNEARPCGVLPIVVADAAIVQDGKTLLMVEKEGLSTIRRYHVPQRPGSATMSMVSRGTTTIGAQWSDAPEKEIAGKDDSDAAAAKRWEKNKEAVFTPNGGVAIGGAALSPGGKWLAWVDRKRPGVVRSMSVAGNDQPREIFKEKDNFAPTLIAVSDEGLLAFSQGPTTDRRQPKLYIGKDDGDKKVWPGIEMKLSQGQPTCASFSSNGKFLVVGTELGHVLRITNPENPDRKNFEEYKPSAGKISACDIAPDGAAVLGYDSGSVRYVTFGEKKNGLDLTERVVYALPAPVREVRLYDGETSKESNPTETKRRRIAALGGWQTSNCVRADYPGQSIRVWEFEGASPAAMPVSVACFPSRVIGGLGEWKPWKDGSVAETLVLATPEDMIEHQCPACRPVNEPEGKKTWERLQKLAKEKGLDADQVKPDSADFKARYGINLDSDLISWIKSLGGRWCSMSYPDLVRPVSVPRVPRERFRFEQPGAPDHLAATSGESR